MDKITQFNLPAQSDTAIQLAMASFVQREAEYRKQFLQSRYQTAFDGYSYIGQVDSLNQYDTDMLHSFVLSDFQDIAAFPLEFESFLQNEWQEVKKVVKDIELQIVAELDIPDLTQLYTDDVIGYMMSCNYYPQPQSCAVVAKNNTRLSAHKDVSLFSTFPYGLANGFSYFDSRQNNITLGQQDKMLLFPGYLLELVTNNSIPALNHQVDLPKDRGEERFSFAIFSIPKPGKVLDIGGRQLTSEEYYQAYLSLF